MAGWTNKPEVLAPARSGIEEIDRQIDKLQAEDRRREAEGARRLEESRRERPGSTQRSER